MKQYVLWLLCFFSFAFAGGEKDFDSMAKEMGKGKATFAQHDDITKWEKAGKRIIFLDIRTTKEYQVSHIEKAIWVNPDKPDYKKLVAESLSGQIIVCYCSVGYRSAKVAEELIKKKCRATVYNLYGGLFHWVNSGKKVVDNSGKVTERVHAYNASWGKWLNKGVKVYD